MKSTSLLVAVLVASATPAYAQAEGDSPAESPCIVSCVEVHQLCRAPCVPYGPAGELDYSNPEAIDACLDTCHDAAVECAVNCG